jgi:hypothetical protein
MRTQTQAELAQSVKHLVRRELKQERGTTKNPWLKEAVMASIDLWTELPAEEQETLLESLTKLVSLRLNNHYRAGDKTLPARVGSRDTVRW